MARQTKKLTRPVPDLSFEDAARIIHGGAIAGVDEAGRGPWAGPVVAGAVVLTPSAVPEGLNDSKVLSGRRRVLLYDVIWENCDCGVGIVEPGEIDEINILQATMKAMRLAVEDLSAPAVHCLIDGNRCPDLSCSAEAIVKGDGRSLSIAAASIIAKVTRDRIMVALDAQYPGYGWKKNMGYGTKTHLEGLAQLGSTPEHRQSFAPVRKVTAANVQLQQKGR